MAISPVSAANNIHFLNKAYNKRETVALEPEVGNAARDQKASLYNPGTGAAMTQEEAEQVYQQVTSQPHWNRQDVNFYAGPPMAMKITEKVSVEPSSPTPSATTADAVVLVNEVKNQDKEQTEGTQLYNPGTGEAITHEEAAQLYQQVTSQPNWNRHDVNFYTGPPEAIKVEEKQLPAASVVEAVAAEISSEDAARSTQSAVPVNTAVVSSQTENPVSLNKNTVQSQLSETVKAETESTTQELLKPLWNERDFEYYQRWLEILTGNDSDHNKPAWKELPNSSGRRFWDSKI